MSQAGANGSGGGGGGGSVTSFSFTDANGFDGTVTNPTTTPNLTLTTTVANTQVFFSTSGALSGEADLTYTAASNILNIGNSTSSSNGTIIVGGSGTGIGNVTGGGGQLNITGGDLLLSTNIGGGHTLTLETEGVDRLVIDDDGAWLVGGSAGSSGNVLTSNGAGTPPTWQAGGGGGGITTINGNTGSVTGSAVSIETPASTGTLNFSGASTTLTLNIMDSNGGLAIGNSATIGSLNGIALGTSANAATNSSIAIGSSATVTSGSGISIGSFTSVSGGGVSIIQGASSSGSRSIAIGNSASSSGDNSIVLGTSATDNGGAGAVSIGNGASSGPSSTVLGENSGSSNSSGDSNIYLKNAGSAAESNVTRIGTQGSGSGQQNACYIAGIAGVSVSNSTAVLIDTTTGQLGTVVSSLRYKENVEDLKDSSILNLRPVTFNYKSDSSKTIQCGLIAEEVNEIMPDLVVYDKEGRPDSVKYHDIAIFLLVEIQKLKTEIESLKRSSL